MKYEEFCISVGRRLREERERLKFSQKGLASVLVVSPRTQIKYESGESSPDAAYLMRFAREGADVLYIVTGERVSNLLTTEQQSLIEAYEASSDELRDSVFAILSYPLRETRMPSFVEWGELARERRRVLAAREASDRLAVAGIIDAKETSTSAGRRPSIEAVPPASRPLAPAPVPGASSEQGVGPLPGEEVREYPHGASKTRRGGQP